MKKIALLTLVVILGLSLLAGCGTTATSSSSSSASASSKDAITIVWTPNQSVARFKDLRAEFDKVIADATGKKVVDKLATDSNIAISALEKGEAQLAWFGTKEYLESHAKDPKIVPLVLESGNLGTLQDSLCYSRFVVKKGNEDQYKSGNNYTIDNIAGKKITYVYNSTPSLNLPVDTILDYFTKQDKWKSLTKDDLFHEDNTKFFSKVSFSATNQLSLLNLLIDNVEVALVTDTDVSEYVTLTSGTANAVGSVYSVKSGAASPLDKLAGAQFVVINSIPLQNIPLAANSAFLSQENIDAITKALTSDTVTKNPKIFPPKGSSGAIFVQPHHFLKVDDAWYNPTRQVYGIKS